MKRRDLVVTDLVAEMYRVAMAEGIDLAIGTGTLVTDFLERAYNEGTEEMSLFECGEVDEDGNVVEQATE